MFSSVLFLSVFTVGVMAGSICPPREDIYPCSCINRPLGKNKYFTSLYCHRMESTDSMNYIFSTLRKMDIDVLHLYDSFWEAHKNKLDEKKRMPTDWLTLLRVTEIEIVDTTLDSCFACPSKLACRNAKLTKFAAVNSSSHEKICTLCDSGRNNMFSWINCMTRLKEFHFIHGKLSSIGADFIPQQMKELTILNLTYNEITTVNPKLFQNLPRLKALDLSHNSISSLSNMFTNDMKNLESLDVSWNLIATLGSNFFTKLQFLKTFNAENNLIVDLKEDEWKGVTDNLKYTNLIGNQLHCDCGIKWINGTFHVSNVIVGHCASPEEYEGSLIRTASRHLNERCTGSSIGTRLRRTTKAMKIL